MLFLSDIDYYVFKSIPGHQLYIIQRQIKSNHLLTAHNVHLHRLIKVVFNQLTAHY